MKKKRKIFYNILNQKMRVLLNDKKEYLATKEDLLKVEAKLGIKMAENKSEMIKWMFIFWASQLAATFAFLKFFIKQ